MVESGQIVFAKQTHSGSQSFKLQPAPSGRGTRTGLAPVEGIAVQANVVESPIDPGFAQASTDQLKSVFEDEDEAEQDVVTPRASLVFSPMAMTPTPASVEQTFVQKLRLQTSCLPQRTLMRSLSSTCLLSPTSPESKATLLRKRLGWRGQKAQKEIAIPISPESPLSPNRARQLHTPTTANSLHSISSTMLSGRGSMDYSVESKDPLSATLKALGAKRHSEAFQVDRMTSFSDDVDEVRTATRKSFFLPTWAKVRNNDQKRAVVLEENRTAAQGFQTLLLPRDFKDCNVQEDEKSTAIIHDDVALPRISQAGGIYPLSPNGNLFSGFEEVKAATVARPQPVVGDQVQIVHRPAIATLRSNRNKDCASGKVTGIVNALCGTNISDFGQRGGELPDDDRTDFRSHTQQLVNSDRRDGWGGILTRLSWFRGHTPGPLVSPRRKDCFSNGSDITRLKSLHLVPGAVHTPKLQSTEEWEDVVDDPDQLDDIATTEVSIAPRFRFAPLDQRASRPFWKWRKNQPRTSAKYDEKSTGITSQLIANAQSVENRPLIVRRISREHVILTLLVLAFLASGIVNIVLSTNHKSTAS